MILYQRDAGHLIACAVVLAVALFTDAIDGYLARRLGQACPEGYVIDGIGDRGLHFALIVVYLQAGLLWPVVALMILIREVSLYGLRSLDASWLQRLASTRRYSLIFGNGFRVVVLGFIVCDYLTVFEGVTVPVWPIALLNWAMCALLVISLPALDLRASKRGVS